MSGTGNTQDMVNTAQAMLDMANKVFLAERSGVGATDDALMSAWDALFALVPLVNHLLSTYTEIAQIPLPEED